MIRKGDVSVPELNWTSTAPLQTVAETRHHGATGGGAGIAVAEIRSFQLVLILARRGQVAAMRKTAKTQFGADLGERPKAVLGKSRSVMIWAGPDQFYVLAPEARAKPFGRLQKAFSKNASFSDQSNGRSLIRISGPRVRDCLAKMLSIDLHPDVFQVGDAAATQMAHMAVNVWRDDDDTFNILVFTSFAESLWQTILDHGAEYGVEILEPADL